jgi:hypothetical protein
MQNLLKTILLASFLAAVFLLGGCEKDKQDDPDVNNNPPVLNVGSDIVGMTSVTSNLSISASDPDGDELQIKWNIIKAPAGSDAVITSTGLFTGTFITSIPGQYEAEVIASDGKGKSASGVITLYIGGVLPTSITTNTTYPDIFESEEYPDYYALQGVNVTSGLTLAPGVVIECGADVRIWFSGNGSYLNAEGTSVKNIIFRGVDKVKGSWSSLQITSNNVNNKLNFVKIQHGGSSKVSNQKTALFLQSNTSAQLSIRNTSITESGGYGFYIDGDGASITAFSDNNFSDNAAAPIRVGASNLFSLDKNSIFTNNGIQAVEVSGGNYGIIEDASVPALSIPYHFYSNLLISAKVTFEPGVSCLFDQSLRMWVTASGTLIAEGTESQKITFSGIGKTPGSWKGIEIDSPSSVNKINYGIVEYGGSTAGRKANIYLFGGSQLTITNSHISDSQTWGIWAVSNAFLTESNNTFSNNALGDVHN